MNARATRRLIARLKREILAAPKQGPRMIRVLQHVSLQPGSELFLFACRELQNRLAQNGIVCSIEGNGERDNPYAADLFIRETKPSPTRKRRVGKSRDMTPELKERWAKERKGGKRSKK